MKANNLLARLIHAMNSSAHIKKHSLEQSTISQKEKQAEIHTPMAPLTVAQRHPNLALPPYTLDEIQAAKAEIHKWHAGGAVLSEAPIDALTTSVHLTLLTGRELVYELGRPAMRYVTRLKRKQSCLEAFRRVAGLHGMSEGDVAGLRAEAEKMRSGDRDDGVEESGEEAKWMKLAIMLLEKEDLVRRLAEKVVELEAEEGLR